MRVVRNPLLYYAASSERSDTAAIRITGTATESFSFFAGMSQTEAKPKCQTGIDQRRNTPCRASRRIAGAVPINPTSRVMTELIIRITDT